MRSDEQFFMTYNFNYFHIINFNLKLNVELAELYKEVNVDQTANTMPCG